MSDPTAYLRLDLGPVPDPVAPSPTERGRPSDPFEDAFGVAAASPSAVGAGVRCVDAGPGRRVSFAEAVTLAEAAMTREAGVLLAVLSVHEAPFGWVFGLQAPRYVASGDPHELLVGHGVTIVERDTGAVWASGSALSARGAVTAYLALRGRAGA